MKQSIIITLALLVGGALSCHAASVKEIWSSNCSKCHAENGTGKTRMGLKAGVKNYANPKEQASMTDEEMARRIKEGKKDGQTVKMPAFGDVLTDDVIKALVTHVRSFKK
jgi:mono/diheme cytochrome c family protein